jgi:predicted enzyme related to lactoylglutathione lyase
MLKQNENSGTGGVFTYWGVADAHVAYQRLLDLGAQEHAPVTDAGKGILAATVLDPSGNIFGVSENRTSDCPDTCTPTHR